MTFSQEAGLLLIGAGIGLITALAMAIIQHILGMKQIEKTLQVQRELHERQLKEQRELLEASLAAQRELEECKLERERENAQELLIQEKTLEERRRELEFLADADPEELQKRLLSYYHFGRLEPPAQTNGAEVVLRWMQIRLWIWRDWIRRKLASLRPQTEPSWVRRELTRRLILSAVSSFALTATIVPLIALLT